jgi:dipeptidyl aminopeptidase/acylaminoacyl peptidase
MQFRPASALPDSSDFEPFMYSSTLRKIWAATALAITCWLGLPDSGSIFAADGKPAGWTPERLMKVKSVSDVAVSPDGKRVAYLVAAAVMEGEKSEWLSQIHLANSDGTGTVQLTRGDKSASSPEWSPDGRWIAFLSPRSGPKVNLWRIPVDGGEAEQLTEEKGGITSFQWSPNGAQIAFLMPDAKTDAEERADREKRDAFVVDENHKRSRLYVIPVDLNAEGKRPARRLTGGEMNVGGGFGGRNFDWSPDGKHIVFSHQPTPSADDWTKSDVSLVEVAAGKVTPLAQTPAAESQPLYSPDGTTIALAVSDDPPTWAFSSRVQLIRPNGEIVRVLAETYDQRPGLVGWSADGKSLLYTETQGTVARLSRLPIDGGAPGDVSPAGMMVGHAALNREASFVGFTSEAPDRAPEAFVSSTAAFEPKQVSRVQEPVTTSPGKTEVVSWTSTDGRRIEGLLTLPAEPAAGKPMPLLLVIHGGPAGVFTQSCLISRGPYPIPVFTSRGWAVLRCNPRGSSGYGREFRHANYHDWGGGDFRDLMSGVDSLIERGIADPEKLGVMGWSYGGFMTSWIITQTKRFRAASVGAGVTNLMSFTGTADIPGFLPDYFGGEYWDQFDRWRSHSAMFQVKGVSTPTLIQHGDKDLRVPISQGYEFYNALKRQNVPVKMVVYPRQAHAITEPKLQLDAMQRNVEWFDKWLGE